MIRKEFFVRSTRADTVISLPEIDTVEADGEGLHEIVTWANSNSR